MNDDTKFWIENVEQKIRELELIAQWGSLCNLGKVRDYCRMAEHELREEISFRKSLRNEKE